MTDVSHNGDTADDYYKPECVDQLQLFIKNFLTSNDMFANDGIFVEHNLVNSRITLNQIEFDVNRRFCFETNYEPVLIYDDGEQLVAEYTYNKEMERHRLAEVFCVDSDENLLDDTLIQRIQIKDSKYFTLPNDVDCSDISKLPHWTPVQVAKFLSKNKFDHVSDLIITNVIILSFF